jgi:hypothetical protein
MIPARIISIDDNKVVVKGHKLPEPEKFDPSKMIYEEQVERWKRSVIAYEESEFIVEVKNVEKVKNDFFYYKMYYTKTFGFEKYYATEPLKVGQQIFIDELAETGKCHIVKIN